MPNVVCEVCGENYDTDELEEGVEVGCEECNDSFICPTCFADGYRVCDICASSGKRPSADEDLEEEDEDDEDEDDDQEIAGDTDEE